ncbi:Detected protein of unknown function [Hibiscus syriacus]|uniref:Pentatricopeptide repeat-containing protein n=1 Tax=Hibiscus syriacus TaxID=106335 RepID=A0A6A3AG20_HIBSY|nr:Detected protein of unknown function [Hibiscus syriacus]
MRTACLFPNHYTFSAVLSACASTSVLLHGQQIHCLISKQGYESFVLVGSALVNMYAKCRDMDMAEKVFVGLPERNAVSWNSMIVGCLLNGLHVNAHFLFREVIREGVFRPNQVSFSSVLSASANVGALEFGKQEHGIEGRDVIPWNVVLMGCVYNENFEEACNYLWIMKRTCLSPDEASYSTALHASTHLAALDQGTLIHNQIIKSGFSTNTSIASSLITMYAKSFGLTGRIEEGHAYFNSIEKVHAIIPGHEHYACMVDLLGRSGQLDKARRFIAQMPIKPNTSVWGELLGACANYGNLEMGIEVAGRLFELEPHNPVHDKSHARTDEIYEMMKKVNKMVKNKGYVPQKQFAINSAEEFKEESLWSHS